MPLLKEAMLERLNLDHADRVCREGYPGLCRKAPTERVCGLTTRAAGNPNVGCVQNGKREGVPMTRTEDASLTAGGERRADDPAPEVTGRARGLVAQDRLMVGVGACAGVAAVASQAFQEIYQVSGTPVEIGLPIWGNVAYAGQIALMPFVVLGLYLAQRSAFGRFGTAASAVALVGSVLWAAASVHQLLDVVAAHPRPAPEPPGRVVVVSMSFFALYAIGLMMLGIATWRAHVLPRGAAVVLTIGVPLGLALNGVTSLALLVYGSGAAWLGLAAFRVVSTDTRHADSSGPSHGFITASTQV
jgi:hypothetical protein